MVARWVWGRVDGARAEESKKALLKDVQKYRVKKGFNGLEDGLEKVTAPGAAGRSCTK